MATYSSILACKIPWTEELGGLQSKGWQRVRHDWVYACPMTIKKSRLFSFTDWLVDRSMHLWIFSTFSYGTCWLSVSRWYLALDGVYHTLWATFPSNLTPEDPGLARQGPLPASHCPQAGPQSEGLGPPRWPDMGPTLQCHPFSLLLDLTGELLHTLQQIPTSMATVLLSVSAIHLWIFILVYGL